MKQLNLKELDIEELEITFWVGLTEDLLEKIRSEVAPDEDGDYVFMDWYKVGSVGHFVMAIVSKEKHIPERYRIRIVCERRGGKRWGVGNVSVSRLLEIISSIEEETLGICGLRLSFGKRRRYKTVVSLPLKVTEMSKTLYDEIHGMHFIKREGKFFKYDVILDLEADKSLREMITFRKVININESILEDVVREGMKISDGFVSREEG
jgi:hypothetical protein